MIEDEALRVPVFRHEGYASADRHRGPGDAGRPTENRDFAGLDGPKAEDRLENLRPAAPDQSREAMHFALADREVDPPQPVVRDPDKESATSPSDRALGGAAGSRSVWSGPTIAATSCFMSVRAVSNRPALAPSRNTVTRLEMRNTSFSRCVT